MSTSLAVSCTSRSSHAASAAQERASARLSPCVCILAELPACVPAWLRACLCAAINTSEFRELYELVVKGQASPPNGASAASALSLLQGANPMAGAPVPGALATYHPDMPKAAADEPKDADVR